MKQNLLGIQGRYKMRLIDTRTNKVVETRESKNLLLNGYLNKLFTDSETSLVGWFSCGLDSYSGVTVTLRQCRVGSNNTPPDRDDTGVKEVLGTVSGEEHDKSEKYAYPVWITAKYIFPAGVATGTIREASVGEDNHWIARQLVEPEIVKEEYHELEIYWTIILERSVDYVEGIIEGGQSDGETDITWRITINNKQLWEWGSIHRSFFKSLVDTKPEVRIGTSNAESNLQSDSADAIKGTELFNGVVDFHSSEPYVTNEYVNKFRIGLEAETEEKEIGELVIFSDEGSGYLFRVTFTPKLLVPVNTRFYLDFSIGLDIP